MSTNYIVGTLFIKSCSLPTEVLVKEGATTNYHTAVKNSPFTIVLGLDNSELFTVNPTGAPVSSQPLTLSNVNIDATLIYTTDKEVDFVKHKPIEYKVNVADGGMEASVEIKLKVLSSQHEDMLFRVKFRALDAIQQTEICSQMITSSNAIKTISKPERKVKNTQTKAQGKKSTGNDVILKTLETIHKTQQEHFKMLQNMLTTVGASLPTNPSAISSINPPVSSVYQTSSLDMFNLDSTSTPSNYNDRPSDQQSLLSALFSDQPPTKKQKIEDDRPLDFETAFQDMMKAFESLSRESRPRQMENFVRSHRVSAENLTELHDMLSYGGLDRSIGQSMTQQPSNWMDGGPQECHCENCPFKKQIEINEKFLTELFTPHNG